MAKAPGLFSKVRHGVKQFFTRRRPDPKPAVAVPPVVPAQDTAQSENIVPVIPEDGQPTLPNNAPLENLPAEIRHLLLSKLDPEALKALATASPVYLQQYMLDRDHLIHQCLETTLGSVAIDACAVYQSGLVEFSKTRDCGSITQFLQYYKDLHNRSLSQYLSLKELLGMDGIMSMMSFHTSIIMPLSRHYAGWALKNLAKKTGEEFPESHNKHPILSRTEELRLVRALYRYQLYCNLFGVGESGCYEQSYADDQNLFKVFLRIYTSWEIEEIACIYTFTMKNFDRIFGEIGWDVRAENPNVDNSWTRDCFLWGTSSRGLKLLHHVLLEIKDHAHLDSTIKEAIRRPTTNFQEDALDETTEELRLEELQSLEDAWRGPSHFQSDSIEHPPFSWTLVWRDYYSDLCNCKEHDIRYWGHMVWDAARLEGTGAKELLLQQQEETWGDEEWDPLDHL